MIYAIYNQADNAAPRDGQAVGYATLASVSSTLPYPAAVVWTGQMPMQPIWSANLQAPVNGVAELGLPALTAGQAAVYAALKAGTATNAQVQAAIVFIAQVARADLFG